MVARREEVDRRVRMTSRNLGLAPDFRLEKHIFESASAQPESNRGTRTGGDGLVVEGMAEGSDDAKMEYEVSSLRVEIL